MANRSRMMFPDSGLVVGPSHSDGGVYASVANGPDVELEGGEFIINKEATEDFLPLIKQINDIGRIEQMNNADNAQNAHSAIDALIASASTKMMPGGGMVAPKTPMYQEGGVLNITGYDPRQEETFTRLQLPSSSGRRGLLGVINDAILKNRLEKQAELLGSSLNPEESSVLPRVSLQTPDGNKGNFGVTVSKPVLKSQFKGSGAEQMEKLSQLDNLQNRPEMQNIMQALEKRAQQPNNIFDLLRSLAPEKQQGGMIQYEEGGPLHSRRMFNQGTGFDKKKSDLNKDGKISEYEKKRGMAIAKSMKNQMQMGGMIGMQQPMMQRPMNPAMNLSPMQRMGNNMPPMMYQEGGSILPSQNTLRGIRRDAMSVLDNVGIENLRQAAMDTLMKMDMRPQEERSLFGSGQPVGMRVPETYGPPAPRKQKEMRQKSSDLDELLKGLVIEVNPFTGDTITEQSIKEELERIRRRVEQSKKPNMQEGGMISDNNLMGAMANDRRVAALQPDVYSSRMQNGMTGAEAMVVPKLAEAILPAYRVETPLSRKQGAMLNKNAVSPSALNPNLKGLVNRLLVQRLANETT